MISQNGLPVDKKENKNMELNMTSSLKQGEPVCGGVMTSEPGASYNGVSIHGWPLLRAP